MYAENKMKALETGGSNLKLKFSKFILPTLFSMCFFSIYTMIDGAFVGRGAGNMALAGVNLSMPFISFVFALSIMLSIGSSNIATFCLGRKEYKKASLAFSRGIEAILLISILIVALGLINLNHLIRLLGASYETAPYVKDYLKIIIPFIPFFMISYTLEVLLKADGNPHLSLFFVTLSAGTNIVLDYIFVIRYNFGIQGAAVATGISQVLAVAGYCTHFFSKRANLKFYPVKIHIYNVISAAKLGFPDFLSELSIGFVTFIFNIVTIRYFGSYEIASLAVIMYTYNLVVNAMTAINQGVQPLVSFYYGRKNYENIRELYKYSVFSAVTLGIIFVSFVYAFPNLITSMYISPTSHYLYSFAIDSLKIFCFSFLMIGVNIVSSGFLNATRNTGKSLIISISRGYVLISLLTFTLPLLFSRSVIWQSAGLCEGITLVISLMLIKKYLPSCDGRYSN